MHKILILLTVLFSVGLSSCSKELSTEKCFDLYEEYFVKYSKAVEKYTADPDDPSTCKEIRKVINDFFEATENCPIKDDDTIAMYEKELERLDAIGCK